MQITFPQHSEIVAGISERSDSLMLWGNRHPINKAVRDNRNKFFEQQGISPTRVVAGGVVHGIRVAKVGKQETGQYLLNTDALITDTPNLYLTVTAADCMPVFYFNPVRKCIGIAHAGRRGLAAGILEQAVLNLRQSYNSNPADLSVIIGPHIRVCHYDIENEVALQFDKQNLEYRNGRIFLKLADEAKLRLRKQGVSQISISPLCTYCEAEQFFSARYDKLSPVQGMAAYIGIADH